MSTWEAVEKEFDRILSEPNPKNLIYIEKKPHIVGPKRARRFRFECDICYRKFITRKELQNHVDRHGNDRKWICTYPSCINAYTTKASLHLHIKRCHSEKIYQCKNCKNKYALRGDLSQHLKRKHVVRKRF